MNTPVAGELWEHYKGGLYQIVAIGRDEPTLESVVIYQSIKDGSVWVRSMTAFKGSVDENGYMPRFSKVES
jgi:hypothetical protein